MSTKTKEFLGWNVFLTATDFMEKLLMNKKKV